MRFVFAAGILYDAARRAAPLPMDMHTDRPSDLALALADVRDGILSFHIWSLLGWQEIKQRYRRSVLGPFWLTVSTGVMIVTMGPLYGRLLGQDLSSYLAYLALGIIVWGFVAGLMNDSCNAFIAAEGYIQQMKLPLTVHVARVVYRNLLIFAHNAVIIAAVLLIYQPALSWSFLLMPLGVLVVAVNGIWMGLLLGVLCTRFRDIPPVITSLVQVAFFITPVMWKEEMLGKYRWAAEINPLTHFLAVVRAPLLNTTIDATHFGIVLGITVIGFAVTLPIFARFRARIAYWI